MPLIVNNTRVRPGSAFAFRGLDKLWAIRLDVTEPVDRPDDAIKFEPILLIPMPSEKSACLAMYKLNRMRGGHVDVGESGELKQPASPAGAKR